MRDADWSRTLAGEACCMLKEATGVCGDISDKRHYTG